MNRKDILFVVILTFSGVNCLAQLVKQVSLTVLKESTAFPFTRILPIHPGGEIGLTFKEGKKEKSISNWSLIIGGFHHENIANAFYMKGEYQYRSIITSFLTLDMIGNIGYMHTFYPGDLYELKQETGDFEMITQFGRPHALIGIGVGITLIKNGKVQPFIRQALAIESPLPMVSR